MLTAILWTCNGVTSQVSPLQGTQLYIISSHSCTMLPQGHIFQKHPCTHYYFLLFFNLIFRSKKINQGPFYARKVNSVFFFSYCSPNTCSEGLKISHLSLLCDVWLACLHMCLCVGRYWETVQRLRINQFYGAPTAIRLLLKYDETWVTKYDRSSLKTLGSGKTKNVTYIWLLWFGFHTFWKPVMMNGPVEMVQSNAE